MNVLPVGIAREICTDADGLTEIRLRAGRQTQLVSVGRDRLVGEMLSAKQLRQIALSLMEHSYYAREEELAQGFFTMRNGCRIGVCGGYTTKDGDCFLRTIGSLCIRVAREVKGCGDELVKCSAPNGHLQNAIVLSRPGLGKTTILRDAARLLSESGFKVGIADERHEIAACRDGVPTLDVGPRTDVVDGCRKDRGMEMLIRSMSPDVIITDEIGNAEDLAAIRGASRRGAAVIASVHAASFQELERGSMGSLLEEGLFRNAVLLDGRPGKIAQIRRYGEDGT